jgi:hypothetical protein
MFSVETYSFLPNQQTDRGNLARQREAGQVWLRSPSHASFLEIFEGSLFACQFLHSSPAMLAVIDRVEFVQVQQFGKFARIDAIILIPVFQHGILARIAGHHSSDVRLEQIV